MTARSPKLVALACAALVASLAGCTDGEAGPDGSGGEGGAGGTGAAGGTGGTGGTGGMAGTGASGGAGGTGGAGGAGAAGGTGGAAGAVQLEVSWSAPRAGDELFGVARLSVSTPAGDAASLRYYVDDEDDAHEVTTGAAWWTATAPNGPHELIAVATAGDSQGRASLPVTVANRTRAESIPPGQPKMTPATDAHPPLLEPAFAGRWEPPVPLEASVNTAGAEDSPYLTPAGDELFLFFTPDANVPVTDQLFDRVTGIYHSRLVAGAWAEPERVFLSYLDEPSLEGCGTVYGDVLWFCSARQGGFRTIDMYTARLAGGLWAGWENAGELLNRDYELGELHVVAGGDAIYFDSARAGGLGNKDIWVTRRAGGQWQPPENVVEVNSERAEGWHWVAEDESEMFFTRTDPGAPEIFRSARVGGVWQPPELVLTPFAGEPAIDAAGNLVFVHHFWDDAGARIIEADLYACRPR